MWTEIIRRVCEPDFQYEIALDADGLCAELKYVEPDNEDNEQKITLGTSTTVRAIAKALLALADDMDRDDKKAGT